MGQIVTAPWGIVKYSNEYLTIRTPGAMMIVGQSGRRPVTKLASREIAELDPYKFMAVIGKAQAVPYLGYIVVAGTKPR
jgi:hypothetical protein